MNRIFGAMASAALLGGIGVTALAYAETVVPIQGPGFKSGAPSWYIEGSAADPDGPVPGAAAAGRASAGTAARGRLQQR